MTDLKPLRKLIATIPPQALHDYVLAHLKTLDQRRSRVSSQTSTTTNPPSLTEFFKDLIPPTRLHCVRCHEDYSEIENGHKSCHMGHDSNYTDFEYTGNRDSEYDTVWFCCGQIVEGEDGDPPPGWCFEGKHTTNLEEAPYREDADDEDDKLVSCKSMGCKRTKSTSRSTKGGNKRHHSSEEPEPEVPQVKRARPTKPTPRSKAASRKTTSKRK